MRRALMFLLSAVVLLGTLLIGGGAFATAQETELADHPLVGSWVLDIDTEDPQNLPALARFSADGGYIELDADGGAGLGAWEATGDTTATLTFSFTTEEGVGTVRARIEVDPDGQSWTATYTLEFVDPSGQSSGELGPGLAEGSRIEVEEPGTPVASFEEVFGEAEGIPEATPAPDTQLPQGVTPEFIAFGPATVLPQDPADIALFRLTLDAGVSLPSEMVDPIGSFITVESGEVTLTVDVELTVTRASATGFPSPEDLETVPAGTEVTLTAGDAVYVPPLVGGELRNDGQEPVVLLVVNIAPAGGGTGTPEASPAA